MIPQVSAVPQAPTTMPQAPIQHFVNAPFGGLVDEDYRLGRTILDEFRTNIGLSQTGTQIVPVAITPVATTPGVVPTSVVPGTGANTIRDFL